MRSHYKKAMERLNPSPDALENILNRTHKPKAWRLSAPRKVGMAAALCAAVVLLSTGVAGAYGQFFHDIPSDVAGALQPVQLTCTSQDITMTVQDASMVDGTLAVYLTLEDISGIDRLADGVDFYHSYRAGKPEGTEETSYQYRSLGYDEESGTYGFLVTITPTDEDKRATFVQGQTYTLSVGQLLLAQKKQQQDFRPDWSTLPQEPEQSLRKYNFLGFVNNYRRPVSTSNNKVEVLVPGIWGVPLADGFVVTAAGFLDNGFHVQMRYPHRNTDLEYGDLALVMADGSVIGNGLGLSDAGNFCSVGFYDEYGYRYEEFIYDIQPGDLKGTVLQGDFASGGYLLDGQWEVSFCLDKGQESETHTGQE